MSPADDEVVECPECGTADVHEVLRMTENHWTVRCIECGHVHTATPRRERTVEVPVVLSDHDRSWAHRVQTPSDETIGVGDEFDVDGHRFIVTAVQPRGQLARSGRCPAGEVATVFAKAFDKVRVKVAVNQGDVTRSHVVVMAPDEMLVVGAGLAVEGKEVRIKAIKNDQGRMVRKGGVPARHVRRAFCDPL